MVYDSYLNKAVNFFKSSSSYYFLGKDSWDNLLKDIDFLLPPLIHPLPHEKSIMDVYKTFRKHQEIPRLTQVHLQTPWRAISSRKILS